MERSKSSLPGSREWMDALLACTDLLTLPRAPPGFRYPWPLPQQSSLQKLIRRALDPCAARRCGRTR